MNPRRLVLICLAALATTPAAAQNVSNYGAIPNPLLFLLREPAVHQELQLTADQRQALRTLNEESDGDLLATRNKQLEQGQPVIERVMESSRQFVLQKFSDEQQLRLRQIIYRLRGVSFVLDPQAAAELQLTSDQQRRIETLTKRARDEIGKLQKEYADGNATQRQTEADIKRVQTAEQRDVVSVLTRPQQQTLHGLVGRPFDPSKLGQVSFKAPELSDSETWFNSSELTLEQLKGKVVALHFWAFG